MERQAASPHDCAKIFGIPYHQLRAAIAAKELCARAVGRHSVLLLDDVRLWIRSRPPTKSSRRRINEECHV